MSGVRRYLDTVPKFAWPSSMSSVTADREWLDALAMSVRKDAPLAYTLDQIVEHAKLATAADEVGIHLRRRAGRVEAAESSNHPSHEADQLQIDFDEGPCLDAALNGPEVVRIDDLRSDPRWPRWSQAAADLGWRSVLSVTLAADTDVIGSLNLYSRTVHRYDRADEDVAVLFARHATAALAPALKIEGLRKALDTRLIIGRAEGVLMERYSLSGDEAFAMLQRQSSNTNQKLIEIARIILNER